MVYIAYYCTPRDFTFFFRLYSFSSSSWKVHNELYILMNYILLQLFLYYQFGEGAFTVHMKALFTLKFINIFTLLL